MDTEQFGQTYLACEESIIKVLRKQKIYDEDLMHDTYIAVYEYSQHEEIRDFVDVFVSFYRMRCKRRETDESMYIVCDNATMIEKYDRIDEDDWKHREQLEQSVDYIIEHFYKNPLPGERNHQRALKILQLYRERLTFREIAAELGIDVAAVHRSLKRSVARIKSQQKMATI